MNRTELIGAISGDTGLTRQQSESALDSLVYEITRGVRTGVPIRITGFGTFKLRERKARSGRNPQTGTPVYIRASKGIGFTPGVQLKADLNSSAVLQKPAPAPVREESRSCTQGCAEEGGKEGRSEEGSEEGRSEEGSEEGSCQEGSEEGRSEEGSEEGSCQEGSEEGSCQEGSGPQGACEESAGPQGSGEASTSTQATCEASACEEGPGPQGPGPQGVSSSRSSTTLRDVRFASALSPGTRARAQSGSLMPRAA